MIKDVMNDSSKRERHWCMSYGKVRTKEIDKSILPLGVKSNWPIHEIKLRWKFNLLLKLQVQVGLSYYMYKEF